MRGKHLLTIPVSLLFVTILTGVFLMSTTIHANSSVDTISVTVNTACTLSSTLGSTSGVTATTDSNGNNTYATSLNPRTIKEINGSILSTVCNDPNGYSLYAIGYSGNSYDTPNNTKLLGTNNNINTGTNTTGDSGSWSMKLAAVSGYTPPTILNSFNNYHNVPATYTQIASYNSTTASASSTGATVQAKYQIYTGSEAYGTYTGKVKYTMVHPNDIVTGATTNMQNWAGCSSLATGSETFLKDTRDNKYYRIVKYYDGKCWMTENLDLAGGTTLTYQDTDMPENYTLPTANGFQAGNKLPESETITSGTSLPSTAFSDNTQAYVFNSGNTTCNSSSPCYSYYSWTTATLGSGLSITTDNTDAPYSICPKGWHLPNTRTGTDDTADFRKLMITLGGSAEIETYDSATTPTGADIFSSLSSAPLSFLQAGYYDSGPFDSGGSRSYYWSSTSYGTNMAARRLYFYSNYAGPANSSYRRRGHSVRCITE